MNPSLKTPAQPAIAMHLLRPFLALATLSSIASAQLVITEINSDGTPGDFWELTNFGASSVNIGNYKWDDDSASPTDPFAFTIPSGTTIAAGESIIFSVGIAPAAFRTAWGLAPTVQVITGGPGLGQNDRVYLFNAANAAVTNLGYAAGVFLRSNGSTSLGTHAGPSAGGTSSAQSLIIDPNFGHVSPRYTFATGGNFSSFAATSPNTGIGSPGTIGTAGSNSLPVFALPTTAFWTSGVALTTSAFRVIATDTDPGQTATLSVLSKPAWLTLTSDGVGRYRLGGTPPAPGDYEFTVRATDNAGVPGITDQTFTLSVFPASSPIFLNEYNAVSSTNYLRGGTATADADGVAPGPTDAHFGRILGNGGQWVEFVVVGNGLANNLTDMRGWTIEINSLGGSSTLVLSQNTYWSNVRSGTILTFILENTANGGLDTQIHRTSALHAAGGGFLWSNINVFDPIYISQSASTIGNNLGIGSDNTTFTIKNSGGTRIYGPSGESVAADTLQVPYGVSSTEILRVENNPTTTINPLTSPHNDASTFSTFGARNRWGSGGATTQSFTTFVSANSPPRFTSTPPNPQITSTYSYNITTADPNGQTVTITAPTLPSFLTLTPGTPGTATLATNRPLTLADAGEHLVELIANDSQAAANTTPQSFIINVFNTAPTLILNEYNAVAPTQFLNGGNLTADSDGAPAATDAHFGRVLGNGGRWFELVVTGNGTPTTLDLRNWTIEIGTSNNGQFLKSNTIVLSNNAAWSAVPTGTILTFTDRNTANGGLNTALNLRNNLTTTGEAWSNIWLGDTTLLTQTSPAVNGYTINGGIVENIRITQDNTQFILKNPLGQRVFGPAGEGIGPSSGVSEIEILELEANPTPSITPLTLAGISSYDDASSGSTFGLPNTWQPDIGAPLTQSFSPYTVTLTPYQTWAASFTLTGNDALATSDPDLDGRTNFTEYTFGGNPSLRDAAPPHTLVHNGATATWTFPLRDDNTIDLLLQRSTTLASWTTLTATPILTPHPTLPGYHLATVTITPAPLNGREFFRATATP
jgi:hypothetical protein